MWLYLLYGLAAVWAIRMLLNLMQHHRMQHREMLKRERAKLNDEQAEQKLFDAIDEKNTELLDEEPSNATKRAA